jgi:hypothetical protein
VTAAPTKTRNLIPKQWAEAEALLESGSVIYDDLVIEKGAKEAAKNKVEERLAVAAFDGAGHSNVSWSQVCRIRLASGKNDIHGQPIPGRIVRERCAIVKLVISNAKSSARADSSASRGTAMEFEANSVILLQAISQAKIDDIIEVSGVTLQIKALHPRYDVNGRLDYYEIHATMWSQK